MGGKHVTFNQKVHWTWQTEDTSLILRVKTQHCVLPVGTWMRGVYKCQGIWERGGCNLVLDVFWCVFSACRSRQRRSDWHERGKCLRQARINMLRQDTEILPLTHTNTRHLPLLSRLFSLFQFPSLALSYRSHSNPLLLQTLPQCLLQQGPPLVISKHPGSTESNLNTSSENSDSKWTLNLIVFRLGLRIYKGDVPAWQSVYSVRRQSEFNWQSVEINGNEERFAESTVVITHAIRFDSAGMWLIFPCVYHHSISAGTVMCTLGSAGDWPW